MNTNDWASAAELFAADCVIDWPQSGERIRRRENFVAINARYPTRGRWVFALRKLVAEDGSAVSETHVTDGGIEAVALSLFETRNGKISRITEYWPDPYPAPDWRAQWVEPIAD